MECIREGVLKEFLEAHRSEAKEMSIFEYDQEKHMRQEREAAWEEGRKEGEEQMLQKLIRRKLEKGWDAARIASELEEPEELVEKMIKKINEDD